MTNLYQLAPHDNMTPEECLKLCARNTDLYKEVIVLGINHDDELVVRSSGMSRKDALWTLLLATDYVRNPYFVGKDVYE